jgi:non-specific serine/threonine protein kinase
MNTPVTALFAALRAFPASRIYAIAREKQILRGLVSFKRGALVDFTWSLDRSRLTAHVSGEPPGAVEFRMAGDAPAFRCSCPSWGPEGNCHHVVCSLFALKNLLNPGLFPLPAGAEGRRTTLREQLLAGSRPPAAGDLPGAAPPRAGGHPPAASGAYAIVIEKDVVITDIAVTLNGRRVSSPQRALACPPELQPLADPQHVSDVFGKLHRLARYLGENGNAHPFFLKTPEGSRPLRFVPAGENAVRTVLDAGPAGVRVGRVVLLGGHEIREQDLVWRFAFDAAGGVFTHLTDLSGWRHRLEIDHRLAEIDAGRTLGDRTYAAGVPAELFNRFPILSPAAGGLEPQGLLLKSEGIPTPARERRPAYRASIRAAGNEAWRALRGEVLVGDAVTPTLSPLLGALGLAGRRVSPSLRTNKRRSALLRICFEALAAPTGREGARIVRQSLSSEVFDRHAIRREAAAFLHEVLDDFHAGQRALVLDGLSWASVPVEPPRELELYRIFHEVLGDEAFHEVLPDRSLKVPAALLFGRLPALAAALAAAGIELVLDGKPVRTSTWEFAFDARRATGIDWFEIRPEIRCDGVLLDEAGWRRITGGEGVIERDGFIRVVDPASQRLLAELAGISREGPPGRRGRREIVHVPRLQILDWILLRSQGVQVRLPPEDEELIDRLLHFERLEERPLPEGLRARLRPYQREGYRWLAFLYEHRLGACLADDMGLGKTVQAISLLGGIKEGKVRAPGGGAPLPHLIVVPPSLLFNWENEIRKFYPGLKVVSYTGKDRTTAFGDADAVLTTYALVRRDAELLAAVPFDVVVFDEAQAVKNIHAETTGGARHLTARFKFAMTGTPLENHVGEYFSIIDLAMPGLLGDLERLRPLIRKEEAPEVERLVRRTRPFVLRRTKEAILKELPPKVETDIYLELTEQQKSLYRRTVERVKALIDEAYRSRSSGQAKIIALTALLRLRQLCVSPRLVDPSIQEPSPKIGFLVGRLRELIEEGHQALVFSQFTSFLDLVEEELNLGGIGFLRLDGSTPTVARKQLVETFQSGAGPAIFLLSLKAGGQGLNLTRASYVFHLDPWWNPAVENQASDRSHRIGQKNTVTITRILMRHTIEEKMMELKRKKLALYRTVLEGAEGGRGSAITREDLSFLLG